MPEQRRGRRRLEWCSPIRCSIDRLCGRSWTHGPQPIHPGRGHIVTRRSPSYELALHLATTKVMSSYCSSALNCRRSRAIDASSCCEASSRCRRSVSIRRPSPNSSLESLNDSVAPSVYRARRSPGNSWRSAAGQSHSAKSPRTVQVESSRSRCRRAAGGDQANAHNSRSACASIRCHNRKRREWRRRRHRYFRKRIGSRNVTDVAGHAARRPAGCAGWHAPFV
jgi:hypothetical protein